MTSSPLPSSSFLPALPVELKRSIVSHLHVPRPSCAYASHPPPGFDQSHLRLLTPREASVRCLKALSETCKEANGLAAECMFRERSLWPERRSTTAGLLSRDRSRLREKSPSPEPDGPGSGAATPSLFPGVGAVVRPKATCLRELASHLCAFPARHVHHVRALVLHPRSPLPSSQLDPTARRLAEQIPATGEEDRRRIDKLVVLLGNEWGDDARTVAGLQPLWDALGEPGSVGALEEIVTDTPGLLAALPERVRERLRSVTLLLPPTSPASTLPNLPGLRELCLQPSTPTFLFYGPSLTFPTGMVGLSSLTLGPATGDSPLVDDDAALPLPIGTLHHLLSASRSTLKELVLGAVLLLPSTPPPPPGPIDLPHLVQAEVALAAPPGQFAPCPGGLLVAWLGGARRLERLRIGQMTLKQPWMLSFLRALQKTRERAWLGKDEEQTGWQALRQVQVCLCEVMTPPEARKARSTVLALAEALPDVDVRTWTPVAGSPRPLDWASPLPGELLPAKPKEARWMRALGEATHVAVTLVMVGLFWPWVARMPVRA